MAEDLPHKATFCAFFWGRSPSFPSTFPKKAPREVVLGCCQGCLAGGRCEIIRLFLLGEFAADLHAAEVAGQTADCADGAVRLANDGHGLLGEVQEFFTLEEYLAAAGSLFECAGKRQVFHGFAKLKLNLVAVAEGFPCTGDRHVLDGAGEGKVLVEGDVELAGLDAVFLQIRTNLALYGTGSGCSCNVGKHIVSAK